MLNKEELQAQGFSEGAVELLDKLTAPIFEELEAHKKRADEAEAKLAEYEKKNKWSENVPWV